MTPEEKRDPAFFSPYEVDTKCCEAQWIDRRFVIGRDDSICLLRKISAAYKQCVQIAFAKKWTSQVKLWSRRLFEGGHDVTLD